MRALSTALVIMVLAFPSGAAAAKKKAPKAPPKIVVATSDQLTKAFRSVKDGGVIELKAGTYKSPSPEGFLIANLPKAFTVRAAAGAAVFLDGEGKRPVLRFKNGARARGRKVVFRGLTFRDGLAVPGKGDSGGVTVQAAEAEFANCAFTGNLAVGGAAGGGGLRVTSGSAVTLSGAHFEGNGSTRRGGAVEAVASSLAMTGGRFIGNRSNLPGHTTTAAGGAVFLVDTAASFTDVLFSANEAAWVGGALYAFGTWTEPLAEPRTPVLLERTSFFGNRALPAPGQTVAGVTQGGAVHAEDHATITVVASAFAGNGAGLGGAMSLYRAALDVSGSIFRNHRAGDGGGLGGTIAALSTDQADASTGGGAINRPSARLTIRDSLLQGMLDPALAGAVSGGCLLAAGDKARLTGTPAVPPLGGLAENRAEVALEGVVFTGCAARRSGSTAATGGAVRADLVDLAMRDGLVLGSSAGGADGAGGGLSLVGASLAALTGTTFAGNAADFSGGAIQVRGAQLDADACRFLGNSVAGGRGAVVESRGAALFSTPANLDPAAGVVQRSLFADQAGIAIRDLDLTAGPVNDLRYDGNRFFGGSFGGTVYVHNTAAPFGTDVAGLNGLVVFRGARAATDKSAVPNTREFTPPAAGVLAAVQSAVVVVEPSP